MNTQEIIRLARKHLGGEMESSARLCLSDAIKVSDVAGRTDNIDSARELYRYARERALKSLAYSVGMFHPAYKKASV